MKPEVKAMAERIREAGRYRWVGIYAVGRHEISVIGWSGPAAPAHPRFPKDRGLCGAAAASERTVVVNDVAKDPRYLATLASTRSEIVVPVKRPSGEVVGLIDVESEKPDAFGSADERMLEEFALQAADFWK
ncbi:MAG TPA: GAF domain-containing protein [Thermoanaerobaculia bacterium]